MDVVVKGFAGAKLWPGPENYQKAITYRENPVPFRGIPRSKFPLFGSILSDENSGWDVAL
jgi:hypothetical protein